MKRILFTLGEIPTGAERVVKTIAKQLDRLFYDVCLVTLRDGDNFSDSLVRYKPDVVFCSQVHLAKQVAEAVRDNFNVDLVYRCNYMLDDVDPKVIEELKIFYPKAKLIIAQTSLMRNQLLDRLPVPSENVIVYHNPVDIDGISELAGEYSPYPNDGKKHFVWVGRFDPVKDLNTLLNAFCLARSKKEDISLYLVGECSSKEEYIQTDVHIVGYQINPYPWIKFANALILCSKSEAMPNVVLEAIALGTLVVCTKCCKEIESYVLSNNGKLVEIMDVDGLSQELRQI